MPRLGLGAFLLAMLCAVHAEALTITADTKTIPGIGAGVPIKFTVLRLTGMFEIGDSDKVRGVLAALGPARDAPKDGPLATAELSSAGGDVVEGVRIGYLFNQFKVATLVRKGDLCLSACALAFLGGTSGHVIAGSAPDRRVEVGGQVGFHNIALNFRAVTNSQSESQEAAISQGFSLALGGSALIVRYASDMGINPDLIARMLGRPPTEFEFLDKAEKFVSLQVCLAEPLMPRISRESEASNLCNNSLSENAPASPLQARRLSARQARLRILEHIEHNASTLGVSNGLADGLRVVINSKDDALLRQVYNNLKALGLPLPEIEGNTFEVEGYSAGIYRMSCVVSFSHSEADEYDLVILGPKGLARPPRVAPEQCRWLFRFEPGDVINPVK